jgi:hypothetical protein
VDRVEEAGPRSLTAVRVEPGIYDAPVAASVARRAPVLVAPSPVDVEFLDLPFLTGEEEPVALHVAVAKRPWQGAVAIYSASDDFAYGFDREIRRPATTGTLLEPLPAGTVGLWMPFAVRVRLASGSLQSRSETEVLNGANAAALRDPTRADWEVIQFLNADLVGPREYRLSGLLRGQAGTDGVMPALWPAGADFVLLDAAIGKLALPVSARGLTRHYRVGPATRPYDDPSYVLRVEGFAGVGLRPYRPAHARVRRLGGGLLRLEWTRRTRIGGDAWVGTDVPLGEEQEAYLVRVVRDGGLLRETTVTAPRFDYSAAEQGADGAVAPIAFDVAQLSVRFGPGPFERIEFDG